MYSDPLALLITWTCYGTWLPGDDRGWTKWHKGDQLPQPLLADWCRDRMADSPVKLDMDQRKIVNEVVASHCSIRGWQLHAVNCRSNHCHVVVTAVGNSGPQVRDQLKAWSTRRLKEQLAGETGIILVREIWWTAKGSIRYLFDKESLEAAIRYVLETQDAGGSIMDRA